MRKNTQVNLDAFVKGRSLKSARDHIVSAQDGFNVCWVLRGSVIARRVGSTLTLTTTYWNTPTTWDRLNAIARHYAVPFNREQSMKHNNLLDIISKVRYTYRQRRTWK